VQRLRAALLATRCGNVVMQDFITLAQPGHMIDE
jgi:hypothetical protein